MAKDKILTFVDRLTEEYNNKVEDYRNQPLEKEIMNFHTLLQSKVFYFKNIIESFRMESYYPEPTNSNNMNIDIYVNDTKHPIKVTAQGGAHTEVAFNTTHNISTLNGDDSEKLVENLLREMVYTAADLKQADRRKKVKNHHNTM